MKVIFVLSVILCGFFYATASPSQSQGLFLSKYHVDVDQVISSKRLLINYANCLLDKGPCTVEAKELKKVIPNAIATQCKECSLEEKQAIGKIFAYLLQYHRDLWNQLLDKFDPDGTFRKQYELDSDDEDYDDEEETKN